MPNQCGAMGVSCYLYFLRHIYHWCIRKIVKNFKLMYVLKMWVRMFFEIGTLIHRVIKKYSKWLHWDYIKSSMLSVHCFARHSNETVHPLLKKSRFIPFLEKRQYNKFCLFINIYFFIQYFLWPMLPCVKMINFRYYFFRILIFATFNYELQALNKAKLAIRNFWQSKISTFRYLIFESMWKVIII